MPEHAIALGVDLATAGGRCVAIDMSTGAVLARAERPLPSPVRTAGGQSRQRAAYGEVTLALVDEVTRALGPAARTVRAISITGTSGTVVPTDPAGTPVAPARLYDDTQAVAALGHARVGSAPTLGRARLLVEETPKAYVLTSADVAQAALAGRIVAGDTSHWLKAGLDLAARDLDPALLETLHLARHLLPDLVVPGTVIGTMDRSASSRMGLPADVRLIAGMTDGCTAQISTGAVHPGDTMGVLGTTLVLKGVSEHPAATADGAVYSHLAPNDRYWPGGASNSGGGVLAAEFGPDGPITFDAAAGARGPASIVRYPLARPGERFPIADLSMPNLATGSAADETDAYRAALEGVALVERLGLERLASLGVVSRRHTLTGGGSRSELWNGIRAALVGPAISDAGPGQGVVHVEGSGSAVGAAILAASGVLGEPLETMVDRLVPAPRLITPDPATADVAADLWRRFCDLLSSSGHDVSDLAGADPA